MTPAPPQQVEIRGLDRQAFLRADHDREEFLHTASLDLPIDLVAAATWMQADALSGEEHSQMLARARDGLKHLWAEIQSECVGSKAHFNCRRMARSRSLRVCPDRAADPLEG
jgi:hypothetical protein